MYSKFSLGLAITVTLMTGCLCFFNETTTMNGLVLPDGNRIVMKKMFYIFFVLGVQSDEGYFTPIDAIAQSRAVRNSK